MDIEILPEDGRNGNDFNSESLNHFEDQLANNLHSQTNSETTAFSVEIEQNEKNIKEYESQLEHMYMLGEPLDDGILSPTYTNEDENESTQDADEFDLTKIKAEALGLEYKTNSFKREKSVEFDSTYSEEYTHEKRNPEPPKTSQEECWSNQDEIYSKELKPEYVSPKQEPISQQSNNSHMSLPAATENNIIGDLTDQSNTESNLLSTILSDHNYPVIPEKKIENRQDLENYLRVLSRFSFCLNNRPQNTLTREVISEFVNKAKSQIENINNVWGKNLDILSSKQNLQVTPDINQNEGISLDNLENTTGKAVESNSPEVTNENQLTEFKMENSDTDHSNKEEHNVSNNYLSNENNEMDSEPFKEAQISTNKEDLHTTCESIVQKNEVTTEKEEALDENVENNKIESNTSIKEQSDNSEKMEVDDQSSESKDDSDTFVSTENDVPEKIDSDHKVLDVDNEDGIEESKLKNEKSDEDIVSIAFDDNRSEVLEFYPTNMNSPATDITGTAETLPPNLSEENLHILMNIKSFGEKLIAECDNFNVDLYENLDSFIEDKINSLKQFTCKKNYIDAEVQTTKVISKRKQRKINEKEKRRLLEDSSTESDSSSTDFERESVSRNESPRESDEEQQEAHNYDSSGSDGLDFDKYLVAASDKDNKSLNDNEEIRIPTNPPSLASTLDYDEDIADMAGESMMDDNSSEDDQQDVQNLDSIKPSDENSLDDKLTNEPVVVVKKLTDEDLESYYDEMRDKEIDRLLNFKSLIKRRITNAQCITQSKPKSQITPGTKKLLEILKDVEKDACSDDSHSEAENETITEKEYLERYNEIMKEHLLKVTSSDSEVESEISLIEDAEQEMESDFSISDDSNFPLIDKFLNKFSKKDIDEGNMDTSASIANADEGGDLSYSSIKEGNDNAMEKSDFDIKPAVAAIDKEILETKDGNSTSNIANATSKETSPNSGRKVARKSTASSYLGFSKTLLKEKEFDIEEVENVAKAETNSGDQSESENSDCEILEDNLKKLPKKKTLEMLLDEAAKRKTAPKPTADDLISLSSESDSELEEITNEDEDRKRMLKPMLRRDQLTGETKIAQKEENERIRRLDDKISFMRKALKEYKKTSTGEKELILDYNTETKTFIKVHPEIVKHLKPHQFDGVKFMYDSCYGSVQFLNKHPGSGCILAHCMGLGKTLQLIALLHTVISHKELNTSRVLVLCPKSTVMNWRDEIRRWLEPIKPKTPLEVFTFNDTPDIQEKLKVCQKWTLCGNAGFKKAGCLLMGYEAFRMLVSYHLYKKQRNNLTQAQLDSIKNKVSETLLKPGADLVICDEGHIIKNRKSAISSAVAEINTRRRIILTGTPIQNSLKEYYSMVNFIKPSFLGTEKEFANLYANPIRNGQHKDSSKRDIKIMKQRSFVLHKKLSKFVQRREAALLKTFLPEKYEYVLFIPMTDVQNRLYEFFLEAVVQPGVSRGKSLIPDYTCLRKIWTHPKVLENAWQNAMAAKNRKEAKRTPTQISHSDDEVPDDVFDSQTGEMSVTKDWWRPLILPQDLESLLPSNKLMTMFEILRMCQENGDKCLIFSAFVAVLNVVEYFMQQIHMKNAGHVSEYNLGLDKFNGPWVNGEDYYRLDGRTSKTLRHEMIEKFNDPSNIRARCFLISAKAGGQGINLIGANRVIILDTSWNPSNDQQNIFRIFRLGQKKNCYVYRLLAMGTMEEKVYSRSVTKQAMSFRVVDEQQIDRHYSMAELAELYTLTKPNYTDRPVPRLPEDSILASLLRNYPNLVFKYHEHDSLLENKMEQELSEQEKADAWAAYERDLQYNEVSAGLLPLPNMTGLPNHGASNYMPHIPGFSGRNFPGNYGMPAGMGSASYIPGFNAQQNALVDMYNMYQNYPTPPIMPRLNNQSSAELPHQFGPNNLMQSNSGNIMGSAIENMPPFGSLPPFSTLNTSSQNVNSPGLSYSPSLYTTVGGKTPYSTTSTTSDIHRRYIEAHNANTAVDHRRQDVNTSIEYRRHEPRQSSRSQAGYSSNNVADSIPTSVIKKPDYVSNKIISGHETDKNNPPLPPHAHSSSIPSSFTNNTNSPHIAQNSVNNVQNSSASSHVRSSRGSTSGLNYPGSNSPKNATLTKTSASLPAFHRMSGSPVQAASGPNISVRSVNSINNPGQNISTHSPALTAALNSPKNISPPNQNKNLQRVVPSMQTAAQAVMNKEMPPLNIPGKQFGVVNQVQLSPNGQIRPVANVQPSTIVVPPKKTPTNKSLTTPPQIMSSCIRPGTIKVPITSTISKATNSGNQSQSANISQMSVLPGKKQTQIPPSPNSNKPLSGNANNTNPSRLIRDKQNFKTSPILNKQTPGNIPINNMRIANPGVSVNRGNVNSPTFSNLPAVSNDSSPAINKPRSKLEHSSIIKKAGFTDVQKRNMAATNAALVGRNNLLMKPLESKFSNAGITISPTTNRITGQNTTSSPLAKLAPPPIGNTINLYSGTKNTMPRKRPAPSPSTNLAEHPGNADRVIKKMKVTPPQKSQLPHYGEFLSRLQSSQSLTVVPKGVAKNNQRQLKEGILQALKLKK